MDRKKEEAQQRRRLSTGPGPSCVSPRSRRGEHIRCFLRCRPLLDRELRSQEEVGVRFPDSEPAVEIHRGPRHGHKGDWEKFVFDGVLGPESTQEQVFEDVASEVFEDVLKGYATTIFCYGQTGTGKTHTLSLHDPTHPERNGIIPRMVDRVFQTVERNPEMEYKVEIEYVQIYQERLSDLLNPDGGNPRIWESQDVGVFMTGVEKKRISSTQECMDIYDRGNRNRIVALTRMNAESSRSHACFILSVTQRRRIREEDTGAPNALVSTKVLMGKVTIVDLAGSERVSKTQASGIRLDEARNINLSLSALGNVVQALSMGNQHVPFRDSKLTRLLQDSLGSGGKTSIIVNINPCRLHAEESMSTISFGQRVRTIKQKGKIHATIDYQAECLRLQGVIDDLEERIQGYEQELREAQGPSADEVERIIDRANEEVRKEAEIRIAELQCQLQDAQNSLTSSEEKLCDSLAALDAAKDAHVVKTMALEKVVAELRAQLEDTQSELDRVRAEGQEVASNWQQERELLQKGVREGELKVAQLEERHRLFCQERNSEQERHRDELQNLSVEKIRLEAVRNSLESKLQDAEEQLSSLTKEREAARSEDAAEMTRQMELERTHWREQKETLTLEVNSLRERLVVVNVFLERTQEEVQDLKHQISQLEEEKAASRSASETQIAALHVQLQEATSRVDSKTREVSEVHAEMKRCREEMRETTNANEELLFQCSQLADRHEKETLRLQDDFNRKLREEKRKLEISHQEKLAALKAQHKEQLERQRLVLQGEALADLRELEDRVRCLECELQESEMGKSKLQEELKQKEKEQYILEKEVESQELVVQDLYEQLNIFYERAGTFMNIAEEHDMAVAKRWQEKEEAKSRPQSSSRGGMDEDEDGDPSLDGKEGEKESGSQKRKGDRRALTVHYVKGPGKRGGEKGEELGPQVGRPAEGKETSPTASCGPRDGTPSGASTATVSCPTGEAVHVSRPLPGDSIPPIYAHDGSTGGVIAGHRPPLNPPPPPSSSSSSSSPSLRPPPPVAVSAPEKEKEQGHREEDYKGQDPNKVKFLEEMNFPFETAVNALSACSGDLETAVAVLLSQD